ncbi:PA4780 family RIO1-like protein kinase [Kushneria aurantia]|uniref:non-specific serine/threonine protein kinase n=1 Tax=Kushneria aurantia TaxID=504092 RepID=A0ABV6G2F4_9GAMM|nr:PA4780 family RIO1-like protein kinase [Kushneria aurantia]
MKIPQRLQPLIEEGVIDDVVMQLRSGKEAQVFVVRCGDELRCAKMFTETRKRGFRRAETYEEGRRGRNSRRERAMAKKSRFGRQEQEQAWQNAEVDALYRLDGAGVRVPRPHGFVDDILLMEMIDDGEGGAAPRLGDVAPSHEQALDWHRRLIGDVVRMLDAGLVHGDLSEFNVLVGPDGPVIIDLPQAVEAAGNNSARRMLLRDVDNLRRYLGRFAPELLASEYGLEIWSLFERGALTPDTALSGRFEERRDDPDVAELLAVIDDVRREEQARRERMAAPEDED